MTVRLIQFTDMHLFSQPDEDLRGVCTRASFARCVAAARDDDWPPDYLLVTGDVAQDASPAAYTAARDMLGSAGAPVLCLPGNHDDVLVMQTLLNDEVFRFCGTHRLGSGWVAILLDSTIPGEVSGALTDEQIDALDDALARHADSHVLVLLHHQPVPMGSAWIDDDPMGNADAFFSTLSRHGNTRAVLFGHVHQASDRILDGIRVISTPSTGGQFAPFSETFASDTLPPAWRRLTLADDGSIDTDVLWLEAELVAS